MCPKKRDRRRFQTPGSWLHSRAEISGKNKHVCEKDATAVELRMKISIQQLQRWLRACFGRAGAVIGTTRTSRDIMSHSLHAPYPYMNRLGSIAGGGSREKSDKGFTTEQQG